MRKTLLASLLAVGLVACGGGDNAPLPSAEAAGPPLTFYPTQPTSHRGNLWYSHAELTNGIPLTGSSGYLWESVYTVTIPSVQATDLIHCEAQAEVTNDLGYNVQVDAAIAVGDWSGSAWPVTMSPLAGTNITPEIHHGRINISFYDETARSGAVTYSLVLESASTAAKSGDVLTVNLGYGALQCHVIPQGA